MGEYVDDKVNEYNEIIRENKNEIDELNEKKSNIIGQAPVFKKLVNAVRSKCWDNSIQKHEGIISNTEKRLANVKKYQNMEVLNHFNLNFISFLTSGLQVDKIKNINLPKIQTELFCLLIWDRHISQLANEDSDLSHNPKTFIYSLVLEMVK